MPAGWVPIIGSGFDAVSGQQMGWQNRNDQIIAANLARAAQAEQTQNQWLANVALQRQAAQESAANREIAAAELARRTFSEAQNQRNIERQLAFSEKYEPQRIAAERERTAAQYGFQNTQEQKALAEIENYAQFAVDDLQKTADAKDTAQEEYVKAQRKLDTARTEKASELPTSIQWSAKTKQFEVLPAAAADPVNGPKLIEQARKANSEIANIVADHTAAELNYSNNSTSFDTLLANAQRNYGLTASKRGGKWTLFSPRHPGGKTWTGAGGTTETPPAPPEAQAFTPGFDAAQLISPEVRGAFGFQSPSSVLNATPSAGGFAVPVASTAAPPGAIRVGRYLVTTE